MLLHICQDRKYKCLDKNCSLDYNKYITKKEVNKSWNQQSQKNMPLNVGTL